MDNLYCKVIGTWKKYAPQYWWGDPLDIRFHLCKRLSKVKNKNILDIGCNVGIILNSADNSNKKSGFDLDEKAIGIAKKINSNQKNNAEFYVQDVFKADLQEESFDIIIFSNMIEMFPIDQREVIIEKITRYLKQGGTMYLTTPNGNNSYYSKKGKLKFFELNALLKKHYNFKVNGWDPFYIYLNHALKYIPGIFSFFAFLMKKGFRRKNSVSFYVEAIKK